MARSIATPSRAFITASPGSVSSPRTARRRAASSSARAEKEGRKAWLFLSVEGKRALAYAAWYSLRVGIVGDRQ